LASVHEGRSATPRPQLLTWGLLGPGKGVEHVIDALALLAAVGVRPRYTVAGVTHPKVLAHFGDTYRESLIQRCVELGISDQVTFDDTYRTVPQLMQFVASSAVVVLPYDSRDQVTSGCSPTRSQRVDRSSRPLSRTLWNCSATERASSCHTATPLL